MALDPSISLRGTPPVAFDPMGAAQKGLSLRELATRVQYQPQLLEEQLASSRTSRKATEASTAQVTQETEEKARQIGASRRLAEIGKSFTRVDPKTGKVNIDKEGWLHQALTEGIPFEQVGNIAKEVATIKEQDLTDETKRQDYVQNRLYELDHLLRVQKDPAQAAGIVGNMAQRLGQIVGPEKAQEYIVARYGDDPTQVIERARINASSGISPAQAKQFEISEEQLKQSWANIGIAQRQLIESGAANLTSPEAMSPGSAVSEAYRKLAISAGVPANQVRGLSAAQIHRIPGISEVITSVIPTTGARTEGVVTAKGMEAEVGVLQQGIQTIDSDLRSRYGRAGSLTRNAWNKLVEQDPKYASVQAAIDQYNSRNPNNKIDILDGFDAVRRRLDIETKKITSMSQGAREMASSPNLAATARGGAAPTPPANPTGVVRMVAPNGDMYDIPAARVDEMIRRGLKRAQ